MYKIVAGHTQVYPILTAMKCRSWGKSIMMGFPNIENFGEGVNSIIKPSRIFLETIQ